VPRFAVGTPVRRVLTQPVGRPPRRRPDELHELHPPVHSDIPEGEVTIVSVSIKPLEDRIVVKSVEAEQTTASGLVIPDTAKEKPQEGEVLAVGPGRIDDKGNRVPLDITVGDRVIYSKYGGTEVKHKGDEYLILSARDVLAVVG
jgi:chaperonin GroES